MNTEKLLTLGREWIKGSYHRVYLTKPETLIGFTYSLYNSGKISTASLKGEQISNNRGYKILVSFDKMYVDVKTGTVHSNELADADVIDEIQKIVNAL